MLYDSNNPVDADRARRKLNELIEKGSVFELTEKNRNDQSGKILTCISYSGILQ